MPNRKKNRSNSALWFLALAGLGVLAGLAAYVKYSGADHVPADLARRDPTANKAGTSARTPKDVMVLTPTYEGDRLKFTEKPATPPSHEDPKVFAVNEFLKSSPVAPDARVTAVSMKGKIASLDFNDALQKGYGSEDERTLLEGIKRVMGQFPEVDGITFLVDGQPIDTIGGVDLSEPIPVVR